MNLRQGLDKLKFDVRMIDLNVRTGTISTTEVKKHLENLDDAQSNTTPLEIDENEGASSYSDDN
jgi:hypothetical protein